jgi:lipoyl-dependent peroxiredoxin
VTEQERRANISWEGGLEGGTGTIWGETRGLRQLLVKWVSRTQSSGSWTSPEEILAAAHASSYAMALARTLADFGATIQRFDVGSTLAVEIEDGPPKMTRVKLTVMANLGGLDDAGLAAAAEKALAECPISALLQSIGEITVETTLRPYRVALPAEGATA